MKASTRVKMAVLALAVCALVALPAFAYGHVLSAGSDLMIDSPHKATPHVVEDPVVVEHVAIDPDLLDAILAADAADDSEDDGPFPDGGGEAAPSVDEFEEHPTFPDGGGDEMVPDEPEITDAGDDGIVERQTEETTPTPTVPDRPYLPYTGGNSLGWILAGVAVAALGIAVAAAGYGAGARRTNEQ